MKHQDNKIRNICMGIMQTMILSQVSLHAVNSLQCKTQAAVNIIRPLNQVLRWNSYSSDADSQLWKLSKVKQFSEHLFIALGEMHLMLLYINMLTEVQHVNQQRFWQFFKHNSLKTYYFGALQSKNFGLTSRVTSATLVSGNLIFTCKGRHISTSVSYCELLLSSPTSNLNSLNYMQKNSQEYCVDTCTCNNNDQA